MNFSSQTLAVIGMIATIVGCGGYRNIHTNSDKTVDFQQYQTFAWAPDSLDQPSDAGVAGYDKDIVRNNAKNYITHLLSQRGFLIDTDSPDLVLELVLLNEKQERIVTYHQYPGYYYYNPYYFPFYYPHPRFYTWYGRSWHGFAYAPFWHDQITTTQTKTFIKGTITINVYDRKLRKLVWTGSAEGDIYDPAYIQHAVHPAIERIMNRFPVKPVPRQKGIEYLNGNNKIVRLE